MSDSHFCLSVTLLDAAFHGRGDDGVPEWPPSPLRIFQALVNAAALRWVTPFDAETAAAFAWLESLDPPTITAPPGKSAALPYRLYVPNNHGDLMVKQWAAGNSAASMATERTAKDVQPTRLVGGDALSGGTTIRYLWRLPERADDSAAYRSRLAEAARSLTHLGWGIDQAVGHAAPINDSQAAELLADPRTQCWTPAATGRPLRIPQPDAARQSGTFGSLIRRHAAFLRRMAGGVPNDVPPLSADQFRLVPYRRGTDPPDRPFAAFELRQPGSSGFCAFNPTLRTKDVAGMVRHSVSDLALRMEPFGWDHDGVGAFVHGHTLEGGDAGARFSYLPLPSLQFRGQSGRHAGQIRRVLIVAPPEHRKAVDWVRALAGQALKDLGLGGPTALLTLIDKPHDQLAADDNFGPYIGESAVWSTVTPVLLPGLDDPGGVRKRLRKVADMTGNASEQKRLLEKLDRRVEALLRKAFLQAGWPGEIVRHAELEFRKPGFRSGVDLATRYEPPRNLRNWPRYHVRVRFRSAAGSDLPVRGPLFVGAGRHRGLGVFAAEE